MSIKSHHPLFTEHNVDWVTMRDTYAGERKIKEAGRMYLPPTPGQEIDGMGENQIGLKNYKAYKLRAKFPDFVAQAIEALIGVMHHKPPTIELPATLEPLRESASVQGESLEMVLRRINEQQLIVGRLGLMADVMTGTAPSGLPYISMYHTEHIINWDDGRREDPILQNLNLVVLNESELERKNIFEWDIQEKYRVLILGDPQENEAENAQSIYQMGLFRDETEFGQGLFIEPQISNNRLNRIPFVFVNSKDIVATPDDPPLLGLANLALTVYRGEADYRQALFNQGQDTFVTIGAVLDSNGTPGSDEVRTGAGSRVAIADGGDAKFVGVDGSGLSEMRLALENDNQEAAEIGAKLLNNRTSQAESGEALRIRVSARTASLTQIAKAGAEGLQEILRIMAIWVGANPEEVIVTPNTDFDDARYLPEQYIELKSLELADGPITDEDIFEVLKRDGIVPAERTYAEQLVKKAEERARRDPDNDVDGTTFGGNPEPAMNETEQQEASDRIGESEAA